MIKTVLVVDDSQVQCQFAVDLCRNLITDANISSAYNGREALDVLAHAPADLVLIDLEMPVMDGIELIGEISSRQLSCAVLIMSSKEPKLISSVGVMAEAGGLTVLGCYQKPISEEVLQRALDQFRGRNDTARQAAAGRPQISPADISRGMEQHQFSLHFQPKLTSRSLMLKGVEALARWQHPELGAISPIEFIEAAEKSGQIYPLTLHLLELALQQKAAWNQQGLNFSLAFNLSPSLLEDDKLVDTIEIALGRYAVQPRNITLEVTENVMLGDVAKSLQTLTRLRLKGFGISLDDYGTGFANAEQLVRLPITELKLDRSLIDGISNKPQLAKFLASTINLAADLELTTVAEGVETLEDFQLLRQYNVSEVQGYYFSRPIPADAFNNWLANDLPRLRAALPRSGA